MAYQQDDANDLFDDKHTRSGDRGQQRAAEQQKLQIVGSKPVQKNTNDSTTVSSSSTKIRKKDISRSSNSPSGSKLGCSASATREHSLLSLPHAEKEADVLLAVKRLMNLNKNTEDKTSEDFSSVHCEPVNERSSKRRRKYSEELASFPSTNAPPTRETSRTPPSISPERTSASSCIPLLSCMQDEWAKKEWKSINVLMSKMTDFTSTKLRLTDPEDELAEHRVERPLERVHFFTPEAEKKYRSILETLQPSECKISPVTQRNFPLGPGGKRKCPDDFFFTEPTEAPTSAEAQIEAILGPIPPPDSNLFQGMSFLLAQASRHFIDHHQLEAMETTDDAENVEQWTRRPFLRERLVAQVKAGGGQVYEHFELIPQEKYKTTKFITNVPNIMAKSLLCLSVGIESYNHQWIIRCCQENKIVNPAEEQLPAGWSLIRGSYVEMFQRPSQKPFQSVLPVVVVIPMHPAKQQFISLWGNICANAGAAVLLVKDPADDFLQGTVVLMHSLCPSWVVEKAKSWGIPLVSTRWPIQCLIEGQICSYDAHPSFKYNYTVKPQSFTPN